MKKRFTDIFICRPVLAVVISLLIFILGIKSILDLPVRQYPRIDSTLITITTFYPGAPPALVEGFITQQIERSVATAQGIDYMDSSSTDGQSLINVHIKLNYDSNAAFTDVMSKVAQIQNFLPKEAELPVINKQSDSTTSILFIAYDSNKMSAEQITDYIRRAVQPKLETIDGVASAQILGGKTYAMRVWLNTRRMASLGVTPVDVANVLTTNNFQSAAGGTKGYFVELSINATTDAADAETFANLVVKEDKHTLVRMRDISRIVLGSETYNSSVYLNNNKAVFVAVNSTPTANPLNVIRDVKRMLPSIQAVYPPTLTSKIVYDATTFIRAAMHEVLKTIFEAACIVILVMLLFLASFRAVIIPVVTIPLSMIGVVFFMYLMGYSLNLLTLLAMVLAIGLVVDDAIVVVENVHRHIELGAGAFKAAIQGAREIATPVITMTVTLAAVYAPIGFMKGLTGALFTEFAFTLAGAVIVSGIVALTLSPMMCSKLLVSEHASGRVAQSVDRFFLRLKNSYERVLFNVLNQRKWIVIMSIAILACCFYFYVKTPSELAPVEDQGVLLIMGTAPEYANITYVERNSAYLNNLLQQYSARADDFIVNGMSGVNTMFGGLMLKPWGERESQFKIQPRLQETVNTVPGLQTVTFPMPPLPGSGSGLPVQFVINSIGPYTEIFHAAERIKTAAANSGLFLYIDDSLKFNKPETMVNINRNMAGNLGIRMQDIGADLAYAFGGNFVNWFPMLGQSYKVIPQTQQRFRLDPDAINYLYIATASGKLVPLSTLATIGEKIEPNALTHFQQQNSATIQGVLAPMVTMGQALKFLRGVASRELSEDMSVDFAGQMRQYVQEGSGLIITLVLSLIVIFLVLSAQFESFRDPLVILISVPMSICGALIVLNLFSTWTHALTINIYTQIGLITLIGLISKHGILIVEFANQLQLQQKIELRQAVLQAAATRLRPILMTTAAMVLGVVPLLIAQGAGAQSRFAIGVVVFSGLLVGTLFTLFVVPTMYTLIAKQHQPLPVPDEDSLPELTEQN